MLLLLCVQLLSHVWLFCDLVDCSPPPYSVHGISQARILDWVAVSSSRRSLQPRDRMYVFCTSCIAGGFFFFFFNWRLISLQYSGGFCHTLTWIKYGAHVFPSLWVVSVHWLWVLCFMHQTWTSRLFHIWQYTCFNAILSNQTSLAFSHRVQKFVLYIRVSFAVLHIGPSLPSF